MLLQGKIVFTFNKLFFDLVRDAKDASPELKAVVKKHYKVKDLTSDAYFESFVGAVPEEVLTVAATDGVGVSILEKPCVTSLELLKGVTVPKLALMMDAHTLASYLYCFLLLVHVYDAAAGDDNDNAEAAEESENAGETLFETVMSAISSIQHKQDVTFILDQILDDDIKNTILNLKTVMALKPDEVNVGDSSSSRSAGDSSDPTLPPGMEGLAEMLEGSKIANLAKEITQDIDLSKISVEKPEDMLKVITDQNIMGDIIGKVGGKIQEKLKKGDINQEDFVKEAMGMLGNMKNNPLFANVMKNFNQGEVRKMSTRDRLRKKYEQKQSHK